VALFIFYGAKVLEVTAVKSAKNSFNVFEMILDKQKSRIKDSANFLVEQELTKQILEKKNYNNWFYHLFVTEIMPSAKNDETDILTVVDSDGYIIADINNQSRYEEKFYSIDPLVQKALKQKKEIFSYEILKKEDTKRQGKKFFRRIWLEKLETKGSKPGFKKKHIEEEALTTVYIKPIISKKTKKVLGAVITAYLLNGRNEILDKAQIGNENLLLTIFKDDLRIATNIVDKDGKRDIGTLLPEKIVDSVLIKGKEYTGMTKTINTDYYTYCTPIKNTSSFVIGAFCSGISQKTLAGDLINALGIKFLIGLGVAFFIIFLLILNFANKLTDPVIEMAQENCREFLENKEL
jgi:hypothetical protein